MQHGANFQQFTKAKHGHYTNTPSGVKMIKNVRTAKSKYINALDTHEQKLKKALKEKWNSAHGGFETQDEYDKFKKFSQTAEKVYSKVSVSNIDGDAMFSSGLLGVAGRILTTNITLSPQEKLLTVPYAKISQVAALELEAQARIRTVLGSCVVRRFEEWHASNNAASRKMFSFFRDYHCLIFL